MDLRKRDFLKLLDYTPEEIRYLLDLAKDFKKKKHEGIEHKYLQGKNIAIIFEKDSTRTRCSFEVASYDLGANVTYLGPTGSQMGKKRALLIQLGFYVECMMELNIEDLDKILLKNWLNILQYLYGMD